jgi:branched-chain amino acid transport system permease protein
MIAFILAGLVLGGIYAISAASIVVTYVSAGVLNFAFGAIAFFIARLYYYLVAQLGWPVFASAIVAIAIAGPLLGIVLYFALFRFLAQAQAITKVVATIGLSVAIPAATELIFGDHPILTSPGLAPPPEHVFHVGGVAITLDQIIAYCCVVAVLAIGTWVLRRTQVGLLVRATVDSKAMTSLSGISPARIAVGVWAAGTFLAGLAGVLAAPVLNVSSVSNYTVITASAFAAVVAAKLRSLPVAVGIGLLMGVLGSVLQWALPSVSSLVTGDIIAAIPFVMVVIFLLYYTWRKTVTEETLGGILDKAVSVRGILPQAEAARSAGASEASRASGASGVVERLGGYAAKTLALGPRNPFVVITAVLPLVLSGFWLGPVAEGLAIAIVFLSFTLLTGEGGMISLCQISFAGVGGLTAAQMNATYHLPVLLGVLVGALLAGACGLVVGLLTARMGNLYAALATLTLALLLSAIVFQLNVFLQYGAGVTVSRPSFAESNVSLTYLTLAVFVAISLFIAAIRRSTSGLALSAIRATETGARSAGVSVVRLKVGLWTLAAAIAGTGGGMYVIYNGVALPQSFDAIIGLTWFAVVITNGRRSNNAALAAGLCFTLIPQLFTTYLPTSLGQVPTLLFGAGAVLLARNPDGIITMNGRQITALARRLSGSGRHTGGGQPLPAGHAAGRVPASAAAASAASAPAASAASAASAAAAPAASAAPAAPAAPAAKLEDAQ